MAGSFLLGTGTSCGFLTERINTLPLKLGHYLLLGSASVCISSLEEDQPAQKFPCASALPPLTRCDAHYPESALASRAEAAELEITHPAAHAAPLPGGEEGSSPPRRGGPEGRGGYLLARFTLGCSPAVPLLSGRT